LVLEGRSRAEAAEQNGMDRQTLSDWVHRYNAGGIDGLKSCHGPGATLTTPLICQTGPKTSAKIGCSCSMREKPCISGRSLASGIMGIRS
jgi:hypothetical protein